jgi:hypothetical protein
VATRLGELLSLSARGWLGLVPGLALGLYGLVATIRGADKPTTFWLFVGALSIAGVMAWVAYQALKARDESKHSVGAGGTHHHYNAPVTFNVGAENSFVALGAPTLVGKPTPRQASPAEADEGVIGGSSFDPPVIRLADYIEYDDPAEMGPPVIRGRHFRNARLRGPLLISPWRCRFAGFRFGVQNDDPETVLWVVNFGAVKIGAVIVENCLFENCSTEHIGIAGTPEYLEDFRRAMRTGAN